MLLNYIVLKLYLLNLSVEKINTAEYFHNWHQYNSIK